MSHLFCPRCGAGWTGLEPCPECGYAPEHPGVLGSFPRGARTLAKHPGLTVAYLIPVALLFLVGVVLQDPADQRLALTVADAGVVLAVLFLHAWWFFIAVGLTAEAVVHERAPGLPSGRVVESSALAGLLVIVPWAAVTGGMVWAPGGALGGVVQLGVVVLLISTLVVMGRAVGLPVAAVLGARSAGQVAKQGNQRAKENGGLGFAFLFAMGAVAALLLVALLGLTGRVAVPPWAQAGLFSVLLVVLEAWVGASLVHGLIAGEGPTRTFTCPRCGDQATAQGGRATCGCGLEGPYHPGAR